MTPKPPAPPAEFAPLIDWALWHHDHGEAIGGYGEERAELSLVGGMLIDVYGGEEAPELKGISPRSPAGKKLFDELCRHLINRLDQLKMQSENR